MSLAKLDKFPHITNLLDYIFDKFKISMRVSHFKYKWESWYKSWLSWNRKQQIWKLLGVTIDIQLSFEKQINNINNYKFPPEKNAIECIF